MIQAKTGNRELSQLPVVCWFSFYCFDCVKRDSHVGQARPLIALTRGSVCLLATDCCLLSPLSVLLKVLGDLDGVGGGALAEVVADAPEG